MSDDHGLALGRGLSLLFFIYFSKNPSPRACEGGFWFFWGNLLGNPARWRGFPTASAGLERRHRGRRAEACSDGAGGSRGAGEEASGAQHGCEVLRGWTAGRLVESAVH